MPQGDFDDLPDPTPSSEPSSNSADPFVSPAFGHEPVMLREVLEGLALKAGQTYVDCTLGRAGHASAIAKILGPDGLLIGLDADPQNLAVAQERLRDALCQVRLFHANFCELDQVWEKVGRPPIDAMLADLGLSTNQLLDASYGMSFARPAPLDMRIDPRTSQSAADLVNKMPQDDLANVLYELAQERYSRRIAKKIVEARRLSPITTTDRLAELVRSAIPSRPPRRRGDGDGRSTIDPATRTFMALRMAVNREMPNLAALLEHGPRMLATNGGRLGVISFHSMEDRQVKQAFRSAEQTGLLSIVTNRPLSPAPDELASNARSRSAKLRIAERLR